MKHTEVTPGEWTWYWRKDDHTGETDCGVVAEDRPGEGVSVCRAPRYQTEKQWAVDGPLLASAKDLLAAFEEAVKWADTMDIGDKGDGDPISTWREAISKAKGGKP